MIRCSPIFGLGEINDFVDFKYSVENINKSILDNFWGQISTIYHYGENDDNRYCGFPFFIYIISQKQFVQAEYIINKYPMMIFIYSKRGWSALHEAILQGSAKLIHILMRKGADPNKIGTRDEVEKSQSEEGFGPRSISPKMLCKTYNQKMNGVLNAEIEHRDRYGNGNCDIDHICDEEKCSIDIEYNLDEKVRNDENENNDGQDELDNN